MEWWYVTGHLEGKAPDGSVRKYGFQSTLFRNHPAIGLDGLAHHMAVTDLQRNTYTQGNKNDIGITVDPAGGGFDVGLQDWVLRGKDGNNTIAGNVSWGDYVLDIRTTASKPAAPHGGDGFVQFAPFGDSGYYSWTGLDVSGTIKDHGTTVTITGGEAWMDHQWFDGGTTAGWDWYSVQLDNGVDYMIFLVKGPDGQYSTKFGTRIEPNGKTTELAAGELSMTPAGTWKSPRSNRTYTSGWEVHVPGGSFTITPKQQDQESNLILPDLDYWEGAATVTGTVDGKAVTGKSYTEITPVQCLCGF
ncbi:lipocalin family protein [Nocardia sp. NPDC058497]|uniref:lipocalin family protein n=1 Tax=Nocardia sp. NPDC058497 TaxID=3346529 RepID=UPI003653C8BF